MKFHSDHIGVELERHATFTLDDAAGVRFACRKGTLWITLDGYGRDIVLEPGESFTGVEHRHALVYAMKPSCLDVATVAT